jgi:hypothetical protein
MPPFARYTRNCETNPSKKKSTGINTNTKNTNPQKDMKIK